MGAYYWQKGCKMRGFRHPLIEKFLHDKTYFLVYVEDIEWLEKAPLRNSGNECETSPKQPPIFEFQTAGKKATVWSAVCLTQNSIRQNCCDAQNNYEKFY